MNHFDVFCLLDNNGRLLDPSIQATVLAKYSRSPDSARDLIKNLSAAEADKFHEKWTINFGHSSVAELAFIPVCFEGISIIASKFIEKWQRPGFSEKSTRYQKFSRDSFITPPNAPESMKEFAAGFYDAYDNLYDRMFARCKSLMPEGTKDNLIKARTFDNIRYLLPAGTGTNVACVLNLRDARDMIVALRSHSNLEFQLLGDKLHDALVVVVPTLVKHAEANTFYRPIINLSPHTKLPVLFAGGHFLEEKEFISRAIQWYGISWQEFCEWMDSRPEHQEVPEIFKTITVSFDLLMDYGAFRDLQRHRRCEQYVEPLTTKYGYSIPEDILGSDLEQEYCAAMEKVFGSTPRCGCDDKTITSNIDLNQYIIPLGYKHKSRFQMDLKELYYIVELRTKPRGHISYRRIVYQMYEKVNNKWPLLMQWCRAIKPTEIGLHT